MTSRSSKNKAGVAGVGVDIEDISRFRKRGFDKNRSFYKRIFTEKEIKYCLGKSEPCRHFAARFCAKEAFIKATNRKATDYKSIEIVSGKNRPSIKGNKRALLSMAHDRDKAIAFVVVGA